MCKYCNEIGMGIPNWNFFDDKSEEFVGYSGDKTELREINEKKSICFTNSAGEYEFGVMEINYCPMCGKKLNNDVEEQP